MQWFFRQINENRFSQITGIDVSILSRHVQLHETFQKQYLDAQKRVLSDLSTPKRSSLGGLPEKIAKSRYSKFQKKLTFFGIFAQAGQSSFKGRGPVVSLKRKKMGIFVFFQMAINLWLLNRLQYFFVFWIGIGYYFSLLELFLR